MDFLQYSYFNSSVFSGQASMQGSQNFDLIFFFIVLLVLLLQLRTRRVGLLGLVVMPLIIVCLTLPFIALELLSGPLGIVLLGLGFIVGAGAGVVIGSMMEVKVDEKDGKMVLKGSVLMVLLWAAIIALKIFGKDMLGSIGLIDIGMLTSVFLTFTVGTMIARRAFVYWKYLQMKKSREAATSPQ